MEDLIRGVLQGLPPGAVYGLIAIGFVLAYKTSGVFNLAFGAQAYVSAALYFQARNEWGWDSAPAFVLSVLIVAPALGLLLERLIFRRLPPGSTLAKLVIAIGLSVAIPALSVPPDIGGGAIFSLGTGTKTFSNNYTNGGVQGRHTTSYSFG